MDLAQDILELERLVRTLKENQTTIHNHIHSLQEEASLVSRGLAKLDVELGALRKRVAPVEPMLGDNLHLLTSNARLDVSVVPRKAREDEPTAPGRICRACGGTGCAPGIVERGCKGCGGRGTV